MLEWQIELGVTEALQALPVDRLAPPPSPAARAEATVATGPLAFDLAAAIDAAEAAAAAARDLPALAEALAAYPHCDLRRGARNCVFADGNPKARVMIVGEGPGADEDRLGRPFVGPAGQMLDRMFATIGLARESPDPARALYITNTVPWRPPGNREPTQDELAMLKPFLVRHIALADPDLLVLLGNVACMALLGQRGITKLRGRWTGTQGVPALPMLHPSYLLRFPEAKREAWADLLKLQARLRSMA
ncbi:MAG: uracil-DNA glycosylase [Rhodobacteraceae bacterium]|nr:uracil-DNA glycosylase [Paracoccaceae bacterium]